MQYFGYLRRNPDAVRRVVSGVVVKIDDRFETIVEHQGQRLLRDFSVLFAERSAKATIQVAPSWDHPVRQTFAVTCGFDRADEEEHARGR